MFDFIMNPSFNQNFTSQLSWLGPWLFVLLSIIKIILIAIGSLLISAIAIFTAALVYAVIRWAQNSLANLVPYQFLLGFKNKNQLTSPAITSKSNHRNDIPHLAA
ncbi:MAG: hypothetical protein ACM3PA_00770 [Methanomassiliicoccales archaeon]